MASFLEVNETTASTAPTTLPTALPTEDPTALSSESASFIQVDEALSASPAINPTELPTVLPTENPTELPMGTATENLTGVTSSLQQAEVPTDLSKENMGVRHMASFIEVGEASTPARLKMKEPTRKTVKRQGIL